VNIILTGMMATGKSAVGRELASLLDISFVDTDSLIEDEAGMPITDIFQKHGEETFRDMEKKMIRSVSRLNNHVIATGGGVVKDPDNMSALEENGAVICLKASAAEIIKRTSGLTDRPLLNIADRESEIKKVMRERKKFYARADICIDTTGREAADVAVEILGLIEGMREDAD